MNIFHIGSLHQQLLQGPVGIAIGFVYGFVYGLAVSKLLPSEKSVINFRIGQLKMKKRHGIFAILTPERSSQTYVN